MHRHSASRAAITLLLAALITSLTGAAGAVTIVVDPGGGGDATTIQGGLDLADFGWTVLVEPGTYYENLQMPSGVALVAAGGPEVTIVDAGGDIAINCEFCSMGTRIEGFTLMGGGGYVAGGVRIFDHSHVEVAGCIIRDNETDFDAAGIIVQRYSFGDIHDNRFIDNRTLNSAAIAVIVHSSADIKNNLFRGNVSTHLSGAIGLNEAHADITGNVFMDNVSANGAAIHVVWPSTQAFVTQNTFLFNEGANGAACIYAYGGGIMVATNNIFGWNIGAAAVKSADGILEVSCSDFWANELDYLGIPDPIGQNGNIREDPLLCDAEDESAALAIESPCLDSPCGVMGANPVPGCSGPIAVEQVSWTAVRNLYR